MTKCRVPVRSISPTIHQLFMLTDEMEIPMKELARRAGRTEAQAYRIHRGLYDYRVGKYLPNLQTLEEILSAIGYEIKFVKKNYETEPRAGADGKGRRDNPSAIPF